MEIFLDPNIVYLLLAGGMVFTVLAIFNPGTGLLELLALVILVASGVGIYMLADQNLINWWSFPIILLGLVLLILAMSRPKQTAYLLASIVFIVIGSAYLVRNETWYLPGVNPYLAIMVSMLSAGFFWLAGNKVLEARSIRPTHDLEVLVGGLGEARSDVHAEGSVQIAGELWSAHSDEFIPNGTKVRVVAREGFTLKVEAANKDEN